MDVKVAIALWNDTDMELKEAIALWNDTDMDVSGYRPVE